MDSKITEYMTAAKNGDAVAQYNLGLCYYYGKGVDVNYKEAVKWFKKSADAGNCLAQSNLGLCYRKGEGVLINYIEAVRLFEKAARQSDLVALYNLAVCAFEGQGIEQSYKKAAELFRQVAELSNIGEGHKIGGFHTENAPEPTSAEEAWQQNRVALSKIDSLEIQLKNALLAKTTAELQRSNAGNELILAQDKYDKLLSKHKENEEKKNELQEKCITQTDEINGLRMQVNINREAVESLNEAETLIEKQKKELTEAILNISMLNAKHASDIEEIQKLSGEREVLSQQCAQALENVKKLERELEGKINFNKQQLEKIQFLEEQHEAKDKQIERLKTQKPFVLKVNILRWLNILSLLVFAGGLYIVVRNAHFSDTEFKICCANGVLLLMLKVISFATLNKAKIDNKYVNYGITNFFAILATIAPVIYLLYFGYELDALLACFVPGAMILTWMQAAICKKEVLISQ